MLPTSAVVVRLQDISLMVKVKALNKELSRLRLKLIRNLMDFRSRLGDKDKKCESLLDVKASCSSGN